MKSLSQHKRDVRRHWLELVVAALLIIMLIMIAKLAIGQQSTAKQVSDIVNSYVSDVRNHALVVGVIDGDKQQIYYFGETEKGNGILPDSNSMFEIGTLSEVFTATLVAEMQLEGLVDLSDPVQKYFPSDVNIPTYRKIICTPRMASDNAPSPQPHTMYYCYPDPMYHPKEVLLCDLATHTSGFPELPSNAHKSGKNPFAHYSDTDLYRFLNKSEMYYETGFDYSHSMTGMAVLGKALALGANTTYENLLKEKILNPLHMENTTITMSGEQQKLFLNGHKSNGKITSHRDYNALAPAGGLRSDVSDLLVFLSANIDNGAPFDNTHQPRLSIIDNEKFKDSHAALGWIVTPYRSDEMIWCSSSLGGFSSYIGMLSCSKSGVVVLSNSANDVDGIGKEILQMLNQEVAIPTIENIPTN